MHPGIYILKREENGYFKKGKGFERD